MYINIEDINIEKLRKDLIDYYTSAMFIASPIAIMDLTKVEKADAEFLVRIAIDNKFDLRNYLNSSNREKDKLRKPIVKEYIKKNN